MADTKPPSIAEKVRFWEEQDRINQALIPRVVEVHEAVEKLARQVCCIDESIASAQAQVLQIARNDISDSAAVLRVEIDDLRARQANIHESLQALGARTVEAVRPDVTSFLKKEVTFWKRPMHQMKLLSLLAFILSIAAVLVAILRGGA